MDLHVLGLTSTMIGLLGAETPAEFLARTLNSYSQSFSPFTERRCLL